MCVEATPWDQQLALGRWPAQLNKPSKTLAMNIIVNHESHYNLLPLKALFGPMMWILITERYEEWCPD